MVVCRIAQTLTEVSSAAVGMVTYYKKMELIVVVRHIVNR